MFNNYYIRTGWLVYVSNTDAQLCSPVVFVSNAQPPSSYKTNFITRIGEQHGIDGFRSLNDFPKGWPLPVSSTGSNWRALRRYFQDDKNRVSDTIKALFGQPKADEVNANKDKYYFILEPVQNT